MTVKQAITIAKESGMKTFTLQHHLYKGKLYEQDLTTIDNFSKDFENDLVITFLLGSDYSIYNSKTETKTYTRPNHCSIIFRLANENL